MNKSFIINFLICFISYNSVAQSVKVLGVNHADSVQHDAPFYLNTFYIVNDGNIPIQGSYYHLYFSVVPNNPSLPGSNFSGHLFNGTIPNQVLLPGDSLIWQFNFPITGGVNLYQQAGDHTVIIWPSFVTPVTIDTSATPLYVLPQITSIFEDIELDINDTNNIFYDMLGRKIDNIISLPSGSMYFSRNGKRYIKL
jgi:hypothetical protein